VGKSRAETERNALTAASRVSRYTRFLSLSVAVVLVLGAAGFLPTRRLAGEQSLPAMAAGCLISLVAAALAGWLIVAVDGVTPEARMQRAFLAMIVRLAVVVVFGAAAALSGELARNPLLFWLGTAYVVLLPLEVKLAIDG
jgi:hypothetical protein